MEHRRAPDRGRVSDPPAIGPSSVGPAWWGDGETAVRAPLVIEVQATAADIRDARHEFASWLAVDVCPGELSEDLVLVVYEAMANVVDHAYGARIGDVRLTAHRSHTSVRISVADRGGWVPPAGPACRGHGLTVIRLLMTEVQIVSDGTGTVVHLRRDVPAPDRSS